MRLKQLDLIKYGKFDAESLRFQKSAQDFHLIVGPNEAGKSTVRNAVLELLFGMPNKTPLAFRHDVTELRLGAVLENADGEKKFHRARGRTQLRTPTDEKLPDNYLEPLLGGTSEDFFKQMFGLDHTKLIEGGRSILDASKDLGRVLFQSASGVGSLGPVKETLERRIAELWAKRGGSEYAQADTRFNEASATLKETQVRSSVWVKAKTELDQIEEEIAQAKKDRFRLETLRSKLERVRRLAPLLRELTAKQAELAALGDVIELPPSGYDDLIKGQADLASANTVLGERLKDLAARQRDREAITTDDAVIALAEDIEALNEIRSACINHERDLPLRQAELERLLNDAFSAAAQLGWPTDEKTLRDSLPSKLALKTVTNLQPEQAVLHQAAISAQESVKDKERELLQLNEQIKGLTALVVPEVLRQALLEAQAFKNSRAKQSTLNTEVAQASRKLEESLAALGRWRNSPALLRAMDLPSTTRVSAMQRQLQECVIAVKNAREKIDETAAKFEKLQFDEKHFIEVHKVVTHAEVLEARSGRNAAWNEIKAGTVALEVGGPAVDAAIRLADELVDIQLGSATEAANLQSLRQQIELARAEVSRNQQALSVREAELAQFQREREALMTAAGLPGMALEDFPDWLTKREAVFTAEDTLRQREKELDAEEKAYNDARGMLLAAYKPVSNESFESAELVTIINNVASFVQKADADRVQKASFEKQITDADRILQTLKTKEEGASNAFKTWEVQWRNALFAAKLNAASATLAQAVGAVELANTVCAKLEAADAIRRNQIETMQVELNTFEANARRICSQLDTELLTINDWPEVARRLVTRLRTAQVNAQSVKLADEALSEANLRKSDAELKVAAAEACILPLLKLAGVGTVEKALPLAQRSNKRRALLAEIDQATGALLRDGDGLTHDAIAKEVAEQDPVTVIGMLEQAKRELAEVIERESALAQQQLAARQTFDAINGAANAATAEAKRQEALSTMGDVAEQYLQMATARRLLKWAIDKYRDQKQGPMLQRAGEIFAQLTLGYFTRLVVDHEANPPALFAKRNNGKQVEVTGLSEGTRDQLFLALRIAALELHLQNSVALPFIADDLFINFDDERSKAGFEALRELSTRTQVIFLTHHEHLVPLVQSVFGDGVNVVELKRDSFIISNTL